jgi:hypothetical protein
MRPVTHIKGNAEIHEKYNKNTDKNNINSQLDAAITNLLLLHLVGCLY